MSILYVARLVRGDVITTTSFLARRVSKWTLNEDRRLKRLFQYIWHHIDLILMHALHPKDLPDAELHYCPDAELGGDPLTTKATGGFWLERSEEHTSELQSHTTGRNVELIVSPEYLGAGERVLVIDDFLASGQTILG